MQPIRLIALDMDGTLLTRTSPTSACIPPQNAAALRRCLDAGVHIVLASGRMPDDAAFFALDAGLAPHIIGLNGSVTLDEPMGVPVSEHLLPENTAREVCSILAEASVDVVVFGLWEVCCLQDRPLSWAQQELGSYFGRPGGRLAYRTGASAADALLDRAGKIVAISRGDPAVLGVARDRIASACPDVRITSSWINNFEVNPAGVDKGSALAGLAERLGIPLSQTMAIGDNGNDAPMLRTAGCGVAMGNATEEAIRAAGHITLPCEACGVAAAINALVFGESFPGVRPL
ncbi:MAG: HAD family phosphatase [Clostridia bacterium]|nr:HAD family phosphatase [Clostridia bacterium]